MTVVERVRRHATLTLTPELIESMVALIESGQYPTIAAQSLGVVPSTFRRWMEKGEANFAESVEGDVVYENDFDPDGLRMELFVRCSKAEGAAEVNMISRCRERIETGKHSGWQGYMTIAARRWPDRWGERRQIVTEGASFEDDVRAFFAKAEAKS